MTTEEQDRSVVAQAGQQVQEKAGELKSQAGDRVRSQLDERSTQAGEEVTALSSALRQSTQQLRQEGRETPAKAVEGAAERVERLGTYLLEADSNRILLDVESWARRRPWMAAAAGVCIGFVASRFLKASSGRRYDELSSSNGNRGARQLTTATPPGAM
jgi:ElaB/YqjD/DUF883 family membrane-anchored ribosome-binding protein